MSRFTRKISTTWLTTSMNQTIVRTELVRWRKQRKNLRKKRKTRRRRPLTARRKGVLGVVLWQARVKNRSSSHQTRWARVCHQDWPHNKLEGKTKKVLRMSPVLKLVLWSMETWARTRIWLRKRWLTSSLSRLWRSSLRDSRPTAVRRWCFMRRS